MLGRYRIAAAGERVVDGDGLFVMVASPPPAPLWTAAKSASPKLPKPNTITPSDDSPADAGKD